MPNMTWKEEYNITKEFLDTLDIQKIFQEGNPLHADEIGDLIYLVEAYVDENNIKLPEIFKGEVFNFMSDDEFISYLRNRYPNFKTHEVVRTYIYFM